MDLQRSRNAHCDHEPWSSPSCPRQGAEERTPLGFGAWSLELSPGSIFATLAPHPIYTHAYLQMQELLEKIETNAAARLTLPPGRLPTEELARYKTFLKVETHRLKILH